MNPRTDHKKLNLVIQQNDETNFLYQNRVHLHPHHQDYNASNKLYFVKITPVYSFRRPEFYYPVNFSPTTHAGNILIPNRLKIDLGYGKISNLETSMLVVDAKSCPAATEVIFTIEKHVPFDERVHITLVEEELLKKVSLPYHFSVGQRIYVPYDRYGREAILLIVDQVNGDTTFSDHVYAGSAETTLRCRLSSHVTNIKLVSSRTPPQLSTSRSSDLPPIVPLEELVPHLAEPVEQPVTHLTLDFKSEGIGGNVDELHQILESSFFSRVLSPDLVDQYGVKDNRGILLYGPPGTGKTLIATQFARKFAPKHISVINGAEIKDRYVGGSNANLRSKFADAYHAWQRYGKKSPLFIIIIDEIDALCPKRGSRENGTGVEHDLVTQLLTILDGVDSPKNILVFGLTNAKHLIDSALLRPGRLGVHIKIDLPNEQSRLAILEIKSNVMRQNGLLDPTVSLDQLAVLTENFTPAEIEAMVSSAAFHAMGENFDLSNDKKELTPKQGLVAAQLKKVTQQDFLHALTKITPAFGINRENFHYNPQEFICFSNEMQHIIDDFMVSLTGLHQGNINRLQFIIGGEAGTGKTTLAMHLAQLTKAKYINLLSVKQLLGLTVDKQLSLLDEEFERIKHSSLSVILLDDLENLIMADAELQSYSNALRLKFQSLFKEPGDPQHKLIVIATTSQLNFLRRLQLTHLFSESKSLSPVTLRWCDDNTLTTIATKLGYRIVQPLRSSLGNETVCVTIRDLIYLIKKFATLNKTTELDMNALYSFIKMDNDIDAIMKGDKKVAPVLQRSGSPVHSTPPLLPPAPRP